MAALTANPLLQLRALGQSVWLDYIRRSLLEDGTLARLIADDGLAGLTSNPAIFHQAIAEHGDYDDAIASLARDGADATAIYEALAVTDVRGAADALAPVYAQSGRRDGYVSLEVSPHRAHDADATVAEALRLWQRVDRPNLMIKVPATAAGLIAIRRLVAAGVSVNVTLLFSIARYREAAEAFISGLEDRAATGEAINNIASVASFFLSRIDSQVDRRLDALATPEARALRGRAAIASARLAYQAYLGLIDTPRWLALAERGAQSQRLLWASTGTKDPAYRDVCYVEPLIGPDTVTTLPPETLDAFRDHGRAVACLEKDEDDARAVPGQLAALGIELKEIACNLEDEGIRKFVEPYDRLLDHLARRIGAFGSSRPT